jgi:streptogramin lyase
VKRHPDDAVHRTAGTLLRSLLAGAVCACLALCCAAAQAAGLAEPRWAVTSYLAASKRIALRWSPVPGAVSYRLWRRAGTEAHFELRATVEGIQYFDEPVEPGSDWTYRVQGVGAEGEGPFSEERTVAVAAPAPPREAEATTWYPSVVELHEQREGPPKLKVALGWRSVRGAVGYRVLRRVAGAGDFTPIGLVTATGVVDDTVEEGVTYEYAIVTIGESLDESPPSVTRTVAVSAEKAGVRVPAPPPAPAFTAVRLWEVLNAIPGSEIHRRLPLDDPYDLAYDAVRELLYVSSTTNRQITVLRGADGTHVTTFGPALGAAELKRPLGIGLDKAGNLLVADDAQAAILSISPQGRLLRRIALSGKGLARPPRPMDVAAHRDGRLFVTDGANNQVVVLSAEGKPISRWGSPKKGEALVGIGAVEISADGNVILADAAAGRIRVFTPAGRAVAAFADRGVGEGKVLYLGGFTALPDGSVLVSDIWNSTIAAFGPSAGQLVLAAGASPSGPPASPLLGPLNLTTDGGGRLFVVEAIANRVTCLSLRPRKKPAAEARP